MNVCNNFASIVSVALHDLRCAGYSANSHPDKPGYVVVNDPVHRSQHGMLVECGYQHVTLHADKVWKFIDDRS